MVRIILYFEGGSIVNSIERNPNLTITIEDKPYVFKNHGNSSERSEFKTVPEMLNYMNKWGWIMVISSTMDRREGVQDDTS